MGRQINKIPRLHQDFIDCSHHNSSDIPYPVSGLWDNILIMSFKLTIVLFVIFASLLIIGGWFILRIDKTEQPIQSSESIEAGPLTCETCGKEEPIISELKPLPELLPSSILLDVPFTSQAPFAEWSDLVYQNACEEAVLVMAIYIIELVTVSRKVFLRFMSSIALFIVSLNVSANGINGATLALTITFGFLAARRGTIIDIPLNTIFNGVLAPFRRFE